MLLLFLLLLLPLLLITNNYNNNNYYYCFLSANLAVEASEPTNTIKLHYQYGRVDALTCEAGDFRLPSSQTGQKGIAQFFVTQLGLTMSDAVTLMGGHTSKHYYYCDYYLLLLYSLYLSLLFLFVFFSSWTCSY